MIYTYNTQIAALTFFLSLLAPLSEPLHAEELDYLKNPGKGNNANILFVLDASSSLDGAYKLQETIVNPTTNPTHVEAKRLLDTLDYFNGRLINKDIIAPSAEIDSDFFNCAHETFEISEGIYTPCTKNRQRWLLRKIDLIRDVVRDTLPDLKGITAAFMRTARNLDGVNDYSNAGFPGDPKIFDDPKSDDNGAIAISAFTKIHSNLNAQTIAKNLKERYRIPYPDGPKFQKTPITEALYEAYLYYIGERSPWKKSLAKGWDAENLNLIDTNAYEKNSIRQPYKTPLQECSNNHIVFFTDGAPTWDWHADNFIDVLVAGKNVSPSTALATTSTLTKSTTEGTGHGHCLEDPTEDKTPADSKLDELTGYMANYDIHPGLDGKQTVNTHFVSTWPACASSELIDTAAAAGQGFHIALADISELHDAFRTLVEDILGKIKPVQGFATLITTDESNPFVQQNYAYVSMWEQNNGRWFGNLKKFYNDKKGNIVDIFETRLIKPNGEIDENVQDLWDATEFTKGALFEGNTTLKGGGASRLSPVGKKRYSLITSQASGTKITTQQNLLKPENNTITQEMLNVTSAEDRQSLLQWAAGADTFDFNQNSLTTDIRPSLGDSLNSKPKIVFYKETSIKSAGDSIVFTATNEGYLHAFQAQTGEHLYSFMPPEFLPSLKKRQGVSGEKTYGIDGMLTSHDSKLKDRKDKKFLFFGFRRGGSSFYALDITKPTEPKLAWRINPTMAGFKDLGEAWSQASITKIMIGGSEREVLLIGGGFDTRYKNNTVTGTAQGHGLYIINLRNGKLIKHISQAEISNNSGLKGSIVSKPLAIDINNDGYANTILFNDLRGTIFRCDINSNDEKKFNLNCGVQAFSQKNSESLLFMGDLDGAISQDSTGKSISLTLASGNRFNPVDTTQHNKIVSFKVPITQLQSDTIVPILASDLTDSASKPKASHTVSSGWYFEFPTAGEKSFSQTLTAEGTIFFSTHFPALGTPSNCGPINLGTAKLYGVNLNDGSPLKTKSTSSSGNSRLIWTGPARGLPPRPHLNKTIDDKLNTSYSLHLGIDSTEFKKAASPIQRNFWLQD